MSRCLSIGRAQPDLLLNQSMEYAKQPNWTRNRTNLTSIVRTSEIEEGKNEDGSTKTRSNRARNRDQEEKNWRGSHEDSLSRMEF